MVYINSDGTIGTRPWYKQITFILWGTIDFIYALTLINPALNGKGNQYDRNYGRPGGGGGPPGPPNRRVGRFATISSCQAPMPGGG